MALRDDVVTLLNTLDGVLEGASIFGSSEAERGWFVDGRQIAHFVADDAVEIRLTKAGIAALRERLKADPRVVLRKAGSDWLTVRFEAAADLDLVRELAGAAALAHRPAEGAVTKLPPAGANLDRRRRFH